MPDLPPFLQDMPPLHLALALASALCILLAALVLIARLATRTIIVEAWEIALLYRDGSFRKRLGPGRHAIPSRGTTLIRIATPPRQLIVPLQEVLTAEGFAVKLGAIVTWSVREPRRFAETALCKPEEPLHAAIQIALRDAALTRTIDQLLAARSTLGAEIQFALAPTAQSLGIEVTAAALRDLALSAELRRLLTDSERARREAAAALERARGEQAVLRNLANAARLLRGNPELAQLRALQSLQGAPGKTAPTLILGTAPLPLRPQDPAEPAPESSISP